MARIDRLPEAPKKTLQLAAVIGREFTSRLLGRIADIRGRTDDFLVELKALELIYEKSLFPELAYMFKHALTHDVAYNSLLVQRRRELRLALARQAGDRVKEGVALAGMGFASLWAHDFDRALAEANAAVEVAKPLGVDAVVGVSRFTTGFVLAVTERLEAAKAEFAEALTNSRPG